MNKSDFINTVAADFSKMEQTNYTVNLKIIKNCVNTFCDAIKDSLVNGERVEIRKLGIFYTKQYKSYMGRNPKSGENITVPEKILPIFKPGKHLKKSMVENRVS